MGRLQRIESKLERVINGAFAKAFRAEVQPVEIASAVRRAMDEGATSLTKGRTFVPTNYRVELSETDYERLTAYEDDLNEELVAAAEEHADSQRYQAKTDFAMRFAKDVSLETGVFRIVTEDGQTRRGRTERSGGRRADEARSASPAGARRPDREAPPTNRPSDDRRTAAASDAASGPSAEPTAGRAAGAGQGSPAPPVGGESPDRGGPDGPAERGHDASKREGRAAEGAGDSRIAAGHPGARAGRSADPDGGWPDPGESWDQTWRDGTQAPDLDDLDARIVRATRDPATRDPAARDRGAPPHDPAGADRGVSADARRGDADEAPSAPTRRETQPPLRRVAATDRPWLEREGDRYPLLGPVTVLGRDIGNTIVVDDANVSRRHCEIRVTPDGPHLVARVKDLGSTNGTWVNGERSDSRRLRDGDEVTIGSTRMTFRAGRR